jgi:putative component of toxin-antitoxin plasmid stabilization module
MKKWNIEQTEIFEKHFNKEIPKNLQENVKKQILKLQNNPFKGKPLGFKFLREKKIKKWRIYFLIYEDNLVLYFIDVSNKKLQKTTIKKIKEEFNKYKEEITKKYKEEPTT